jgi:hypothetical protein
MCADASPARAPRSLALILGLGLAAMGCHTHVTTVVVAPPKPKPSEPHEPGSRCLAYAGAPTDPSLSGLARTHAARCCPSGYGFDPELARTACGFEEYLGESEELACVHRFRDADDELHELRITPILDLDLPAAMALHEQGTAQVGETPEGLPELRWSAVKGRRWAFVPGWSIVRRLGWDEAACAPDRMLPVLARMHAAASDPAAAVALPRVHDDDRRAQSPTETSLLAREFKAHELEHHPLPRSAEQLVLDLLHAAITDDLQGFAALLEPDARIGLPDRRQLGARAILAGAGPAVAVQQLLAAAARFPIDAALHCPTLGRRVVPRVTRGETLMWCFWISDDGLDLLAFALRGRVVDGQADGRVAYVGAFPVRPEAPLVMPGEPAPPPAMPVPELVCGDPHARSYPGVCPEPAPDVEGEETLPP